VSHADNHMEVEEPRINSVAKEIVITILFVAGALGVYWLLQFFPGGKPPLLVYVFVIISDCVLILGAVIEFTHALKILWGNARGNRVKTPKAPRTWRISLEKEIHGELEESVSTAQHAVASPRPSALLAGEELPAIAAASDASHSREGQSAVSNGNEPKELTGAGEAAAKRGYWMVKLRGPDGQRYPSRVVRANIGDPDSFRSHLIGIARIEAPDETDAGEQWIGGYELEVRKVGAEENSPEFVTLRWDAPTVEEPLPIESAEDDDVAKVVDFRSGRRRTG
jgi:hypothetical protein